MKLSKIIPKLKKSNTSNEINMIILKFEINLFKTQYSVFLFIILSFK